jgi:hypothetical protein
MSSSTLSDTTGQGRRHLFWLFLWLILVGTALADAGTVAYYARAMSAGEVFAAGFTFTLVSFGAVATVRIWAGRPKR